MIIECDGFILREWRLDDLESSVMNANNIKVWNNLTDAFPNPYREQDAIDYINLTMQKTPQSDFAIVVDGKAVGGISFYPREDVYRITAELGYWLSEDYWGRGIMVKAVKAIAQYAFNNFELHKLFAGVFEHNPPSMRVLEKAGFTKEGILRKGAIKNNKIIDIHYYSLIKE